MRRLGKCLGMAVLTVALPGCFILRGYRDHPLDQQKIASIQRGVTTKSEVLVLLGPPQEIDARELTMLGATLDQGLPRPGEKPPEERVVAARWFRYTYERGNGMMMLFILFNYVDVDLKNDSLVIFFDDDN